MLPPKMSNKRYPESITPSWGTQRDQPWTGGSGFCSKRKDQFKKLSRKGRSLPALMREHELRGNVPLGSPAHGVVAGQEGG